MSKFIRTTKKDAHKPDRRSTPSTPLWVKVFGAIAIIASLLFLGVMLASMVGVSGTEASPGRYLPVWMEMSGFIALVVVLLFFIAMLAGVGGTSRDRTPSTASGRPALMMPPFLRKFVLTTHITASVGWIGSVAGFLALAVTALTSQNVLTVRGTLLSMNVLAWFIIIPLSLASLVSGLGVALFSKWGLLRHYWVLAKLLINLLATIIVLLFMEALSAAADLAVTSSTVSVAQLQRLAGHDAVIHSALALPVLLIAIVLSVYKPRGLTRYGQRKRDEQYAGIAAGRETTDQEQEQEHEMVEERA